MMATFVVDYLTGSFPFSAEYMNILMAIEGAMVIRRGLNRDGKLHWFHAFMLSLICAFGGGAFNKIWMGQPSAVISNDLIMGSCILSFLVVNNIPFDLGFNVLNFLPLKILITSGAQLFRSTALVNFAKVAFQAFKGSPSAYYPIPVFGPIIYGTLLGNMGALVLKGFEGHVENGVPWAVQNGELIVHREGPKIFIFEFVRWKCDYTFVSSRPCLLWCDCYHQVSFVLPFITFMFMIPMDRLGNSCVRTFL